MSLTSKLRALKNGIIFQFLDKTSGAKGEFSERTRSGLIIPTMKNEQRRERWVRVIAVGPDVSGVVPGIFAMVEPLMWTRSGTIDGEKVWKTDDTKILMVTSDESLTNSF